MTKKNCEKYYLKKNLYQKRKMKKKFQNLYKWQKKIFKIVYEDHFEIRSISTKIAGVFLQEKKINLTIRMTP